MELTVLPSEMPPFKVLESESYIKEAAIGQVNFGSPPVRRVLRAKILRSLILERPLQFFGEDVARTITIPQTGLTIEWVELVGDSGDPDEPSAVLDLENACSSDGKPLPPLVLRYCTFRNSILLGRARFRGLSLEDSKLVHLYANGIQIEGHLSMARVTSSGGRLGAAHGVSFDDEEFGHSAANILPNKILIRKPITPKESQPLCWIQLRNCHVTLDVNATGARLVGPEQPGANSESVAINSPHANYALDLRAGKIGGRLKLSADQGESNPSRFYALGGVSIIRCVIGGSVCATAGEFLAVEGCAFAAERAVIGGHVFFDTSRREGEWDQFLSEGFVDFTNAKVGSTIFMEGAKLRRDAYSLGGLVLSQIEVGDACNLCALYATDTPSENELRNAEAFESTAGVRLDHAKIRGRLEMSGARLGASSSGQALYAPELEVFGPANFSIISPAWAMSRASYPPAEQVERATMRFTATAPVVLVRARFHRRVNFRGADLSLRSIPEDLQKHERCCEGDLMQVFGSLWFDTADAGTERSSTRTSNGDQSRRQLSIPIRTTVAGSVSLRRIDVAMNVRFSGSEIKASHHDGVAIDLASSDVRFDLLIDRCNEHRSRRCEITGTVVLEDVRVGHKLSLVGARINANDTLAGQPQACAIRGARLHVASQARLGVPELERVAAVNKTEAEPTNLELTGYIDLGGGSFPGGLYMHNLVIEHSPHLQNDGPGDHSHLSLSAPAATTTLLELDECKLKFSVNLRDFTASHGLIISNTVVSNGVLDLWRSTLGFLTMKMFRIEQPPRVNTKDRKFLQDILHLGRARIAGRMIIEDTKLSRGGGDGKPRFANLRDCEIGTLTDKNGEGWDGVRLKLEGFHCRRFERADHHAHIKWLNRQYVEGGNHAHEEFTPSAYERVARSLREYGHDDHAKKVLSEKLTAQRKYKRRDWLVVPLWWFYHTFFDYGLSSVRALVSFIGFLAFGVWLAWMAARAHTPLLVSRNPNAPYCGLLQAGTFAAQNFIPLIRTSEPAGCMVPNTHPVVQAVVFIYAAFGWLVSSITFLTIPGILRARADG